ncbi:MAG: YceI family protein [Chloroflexi bacterium]|nr:YceI family protein [Chloroflexota bacterium]
MKPPPPIWPLSSFGRSLAAGLVSGGITAFITAAVSLPLNSPDDVVFNTGTVAIACILAGIAAGLIWHISERRNMALSGMLWISAVAFLAVLGVSLLAEYAPGAPLDGVASYVIPLGATAIVLLTVTLPFIAIGELHRPPVLIVTLSVGLGFGIALAGVGDEPSGKLSLDDLARLPAATAPPLFPAAPTAVPTQAPEATMAPTPTLAATATPTPAAKPEYVVAIGKGTYTVREKLTILPTSSDAVGGTTTFSGEINLDGRPSKIFADLRMLRSDQSRRDQFIQGQTLLTRTYPYAEFTVTDIGDYGKRLLNGESVSGRLTGSMKIRGVEKPFTFDLKQARLSGGVLQLLATVDFTWADFNIPPPNIPGTVQVENNVHLEVVLEARRPA